MYTNIWHNVIGIHTFRIAHFTMVFHREPGSWQANKQRRLLGMGSVFSINTNKPQKWIPSPLIPEPVSSKLGKTKNPRIELKLPSNKKNQSFTQKLSLIYSFVLHCPRTQLTKLFWNHTSYVFFLAVLGRLPSIRGLAHVQCRLWNPIFFDVGPDKNNFLPDTENRYWKTPNLREKVRKETSPIRRNINPTKTEP